MSIVSFMVFVAMLAADPEVCPSPETSGFIPSPGDTWLQYDNGSPAWLTWSGPYKGVWFNTEDFIPGSTGFQIDAVEAWFYHSSNNPWDTSEYMMEMRTGDLQGPSGILASETGTAVHYAPSYTEYEPAVAAGTNFWCMLNTEMSAGGWPSMLLDSGTPSFPPHSYFSDGITLVPFLIGDKFCNLFIRAGGMSALEQWSWGSLKAIF